MNPEDIRVSDISTPRNFFALEEGMQAYLVDIELFTIIRQLLELNMTTGQAIDLVTVTMMKHDPDNAMLFHEQLHKMHDRFIMGDTFRKGLVRYFWVAGVGINQIMKLTRTGQVPVHEIAYNMQRDYELGRLRSISQPFLCEKFYYSLDTTIRSLSTFDGKEVRQPSKATTKFDILRATVQRVRLWGDKE